MSVSPEKASAGELCSAVVDLALSNSEEEGDGTASTAESWFFVLPYLGLKQLLKMELLSRQLRDAIRSDVLLWQHLLVDSPLNKKLTDVELARLARRAQGRMQSLGLVNCTRVSEEAVEAVVASNPNLEKLRLPGCTEVSPAAVVRMVQQLTEGRTPGAPAPFTELRINGISGLTPETILSLRSLMRRSNSSGHDPGQSRTPQFYRHGEPAASALAAECPSSRSLDVEVCPKCDAARMVYDCPRPSCQQKQCRGCSLCIERCEECGVCVDGDDRFETFCSDVVCRKCRGKLPQCYYCALVGCSRHSDPSLPNDYFECLPCISMRLKMWA